MSKTGLQFWEGDVCIRKILNFGHFKCDVSSLDVTALWLQAVSLNAFNFDQATINLNKSTESVF